MNQKSVIKNELSMSDTILQLLKLLGRRDIFILCALALLLILCSFAEIVSIGLVVPFLAMLVSPEKILTHHQLSPFFEALSPLGLSEPLIITALFVVAVLVSGVLRVLLIYCLTRFSYSLGNNFAIQIYRLTLTLPYEEHLATNSSELVTSVHTKGNGLIGYLILPILNIMSGIVILISVFTALLFINPELAFVILVIFAAIYVAISISLKPILIKCGININRGSSAVLRALQEGFGGIRDVILGNQYENFIKIYSASATTLKKAYITVQIISNIPRVAVDSFSMIAIALISYKWVSNNGAQNFIPIMGALALAAQRMLPIMQQIYSSWTSMRAGRQVVQDALEILIKCRDQPNSKNEHHNAVFNDEIVFDGISFSYNGQAPFVLKDINLKISLCDIVGIIGETGSGKSTLMDLILGLLKPTQGHIYIDGKQLIFNERSSIQKLVSHVPQTIFLTDASIRENVAFGVPTELIDNVRVVEACRAACIDDVICKLPQMYETVVGERGVRLSGGQRQRIGIARALYKKTQIIVLDEATSALDDQTEMRVMESIQHLPRKVTLVIIAHRKSTLQGCNKIIELHCGSVLRQGNYSEIIQGAMK